MTPTEQSSRSGIVPRGRNVLLDTKPLVIFLVGLIDPALLGSTGHLKDSAPQDYEIIRIFLGFCGKIVVTPHVATEAAHFLCKIKGERGAIVRATFAEFLGASSVREDPIATQIAAARPEFKWLDIADCTLLEAIKPDDIVLSTDALLIQEMLKRGYEAVNLNHLREQFGLA